MTSKRLGVLLITLSAGVWISVFGAFFAETWWLPFFVGAAASVIALVSIIAWAAQLE